MGRLTKVSAAVLVTAVIGYFVVWTPPAESPPRAVIEPLATDGEIVPAFELPAMEAAEPQRLSAKESAVGEVAVAEPPADVPAVAGANVLRVILEGITEEQARRATVAVRGVYAFDGWPADIGVSWPCQGLTSAFDLDPVLARVERRDFLREGELAVAVDHPHHLGGRARVSLAGDGELIDGKTVYEVVVRLVPPEFWPEFTLDVRDVHTLAHLEDIELRIRSGPGAAMWGRNQPGMLLDDGLTSPIVMMGGREPGEAVDKVAGMALRPAAGDAPRLVELVSRPPRGRGVNVSARAPGHAWNSTWIDVSMGDRELLLEPATTLGVRLVNVQLERYAALDVVPMLCVYRTWEDGGYSYIHFERLDETLATEGLRLDSIAPGAYRVAVELGGGSWTEQPVLALEEFTLTAGETRELLLSLADPPAAPERATLGGVVCFPSPTTSWAEEKVRLQLSFQPTQRWRDPDFEFSLADLPRVAGALPSWSFRVEDLPVGMYRVQLMPFLKVWMIDLPAGGADDLRLVLPELAEVLVETVDGGTGERVPRDEVWYRNLEPHPDQKQSDLARADTEQPGRFRFWAAPGLVRVWPKWPNGAERELGGNGQEFELVPGFQSVTYAFEPVYALRFEFRIDGAALPTGPQGMHTTQDIRAVDHDGRVTDGGLQRDMIVEVSAPGLYEISFERLEADRYHPVPPRLVDVRAGETTDVIVELSRR